MEQTEKDLRGVQLMLLAAHEGNIAIINDLIAAGVDVNTAVEGITPLHLAACYGHIAAVRVLLTAGANVNVKDERGRTPLFLAKLFGDRDITKVLLEAGAYSKTHCIWQFITVTLPSLIPFWQRRKK